MTKEHSDKSTSSNDIRINKKRILLFVSTLFSYLAFRVIVEVGNVNPIYLLIGVLILDQFLSPEDAIDRILVVTASLFGLLPVLGWFHKADVISPIEIVAAIWFVSGCINATSRKNFKPTNTLLPVAIGVSSMYLWWRPISDGSPTAVLSRILPGWDNSSHFNFFFSNLINRQYLIRIHQIGGDFRLVGHEYPTGIHYLWSLFFSHERALLLNSPSRAVPVYAISVTITLVVAVGIGAIAIARLGSNSYQKLVLGFVGTGLSIGLIGIGPLSQTIPAGFANMPAVVVGLLLVLSVGVKPISNKWMNLIALTGGTLSVLYNWYPMVVLLIPILIYAVVKFIREERWFVSLGLISAIAVSGILPIAQSLSLGISHLSEPGGITPFPIGIGLIIIFSSCGCGVYLLLVSRKYLEGFTLVIPTIFLVVLGTYIRMTTNEYPYYFQKAFLIGSVTTSFAVVMVLSIHLVFTSNASPQHGRKQSTAIVLCAILIALALVNITGYAGPDREKFAKDAIALGVKSRNDLVHQSWQFQPSVDILLKTAEKVSQEPLDIKSCYTLFIPDRLGAIGEAMPTGWKDLLINVWFHGLTNSYTVEAFNNSYAIPMASSALSNEEHLPVVIDSAYPLETVCPVSSSRVIAKLRGFNAKWRTLEIQTG